MKTLIRSVLGLVLVLGWWTFTGNSISTQKAQDKIPASVWGGGSEMRAYRRLDAP